MRGIQKVGSNPSVVVFFSLDLDFFFFKATACHCVVYQPSLHLDSG